jgi:hypothetical protein
MDTNSNFKLGAGLLAAWFFLVKPLMKDVSRYLYKRGQKKRNGKKE